MNSPKLILLLFLIIQSLGMCTSVQVFHQETGEKDNLKILDGVAETFISTYDLARVLSSKLYVNNDRQKIVLYLREHRIKLSSETSFIIINEQIYQMSHVSIGVEEDIYLPAESFFSILQMAVLPRIIYNPIKQLLDINIVDFNITGLNIEEKANGTILRIKTRERFSNGNISAFKHNNGWFYLTIKGGIIDSAEVKRTDTRGVVRKVVADQFDESVQLAFQLRSNIEEFEFYQSTKPDEIVVTLRAPLSKSAARIKEVKNRWRLNTIVLDAGHGGKDGGTVGKYGVKEKNITLDITKRIGRLVEKNTHIKVVHTREEDIFIPLWKRTKIANENNGKLFISIHANASPNRNVRGFETYLLSPGKTSDAIEVASRENAVIQLEDQQQKKYSGENLIMATMVQSTHMKDSEEFAGIIQNELASGINSKNRGVKQAGFYVLIGASMPNVLIEVGFLSNPTEEKKLKKASYRQQIAEAVYSAIFKFRNTKEKLLAKG